jgi:hypothetical protein
MGMEQSAVPSPERLPPPSAWAYPLKTKAGRAAYALRKQAVKPVFGIINPSWAFASFSCTG